MAKFSGNSGGGGILKWKLEEGQKVQEVSGTFVSHRDGTYGPLFVMKIDGEEVTCATNTGLLNCFEEAFGGLAHTPKGTPLTIRYFGMVTTKSNKTFKRFELEIPDEALPPDQTGF